MPLPFLHPHPPVPHPPTPVTHHLPWTHLHPEHGMCMVDPHPSHPLNTAPYSFNNHNLGGNMPMPR